jgi:hypothetical protein
MGKTKEEKYLVWCVMSRLNVELMFNPTYPPAAAFTVRLTPWRQDKGSPVMYLGSGETFLTAWEQAIISASARASVPRNYSARTQEEALHGLRPATAPAELPF